MFFIHNEEEGLMSLSDSVKGIVKADFPNIQYDETINAVIETMIEYQVNSVLVYAGEDVVGIISDTDFVTSFIEDENAGDLMVRDVMTPCEIAGAEGTLNPCAQIDENETILNALKVFQMSGTHGLVVSKGSGNPAGIICLRDVLGLAIK